MRNRSSIPGCRSLASRYCCIIGVKPGTAAFVGRISAINALYTRVREVQQTLESRLQPAKAGTPAAQPNYARDPRRDSIAVGEEKRGRPTPLAAVADLAHGDRVAGGVVANLVHVVAHQHQAAAAGAFEVLDG